MRRLHLIIGLLVIAAFLITGQIMRRHTPPMEAMSDDIRLMYRSRHIYILASGLVNLLLGLYLSNRAAGWRRILQLLGSMLFLISPLLLILAFAAEPAHGLTGRTWRSSFGLYALFGGGVAHLLGAGVSPTPGGKRSTHNEP